MRHGSPNFKTWVQRGKQASNAKRSQHGHGRGKRARGVGVRHQQPFVPPETWHEPQGGGDNYQIIVEPPGNGYRHVVTPAEVEQRLLELPGGMLAPLEVVQLSRMTRKKRTFPCYGMQWGPALYLYPLEESLVETFSRPPKPPVRIETESFGGAWSQSEGLWHLTWTEAAIRDFYLNNILIHELGHLLDDRNRSYTDRERYAEWFAIEYGYKASRGSQLTSRTPSDACRRRHGKR